NRKTCLNSYQIHTMNATTIECFNPATGEKLGEVPAASAEQVQAIIARARVAQTAWAQTSFAQRRAVFRTLLATILQNMDAICAAVVQDGGKTFENAALGEVMTVANKLRWLIQNGERYLKTEKVSMGGPLLHKKGRIEYRPLGVVACIVPWNYPFQNIFASFADPLMAGNAVVLKASEAVAWSTQYFQQLINSVFDQHGISRDTVQIINGYGDTGAALVRAGVQKILFIGSVGNGRRIVAGSAETLTPTVMELGGKDPLIVCDDADLDRAVHSALGGCLVNLGQSCVAPERILVQAGIYERFVQQIQSVASQLRQGHAAQPGSVDVGAICSPLQVKVIEDLVDDALASGAKAIVGGKRLTEGAYAKGNFFAPTVLVDVSPDMRIAQEEVFGPVLLIMKFERDADAVRIANGSVFGLQSSVFSKSQARAERIASQIDAGATVLNDFGMCYLNQNLPFGGVKESGFGRMNGRDGLRGYTNPKAVLKDRFWNLGVVPKLYPVKDADYVQARRMIRLMFAPSWLQKLRFLGKQAGDRL
ncbi:MAG: aldehyde dehydrogenase family protein, partial [Brachymonas sp.]